MVEHGALEELHAHHEAVLPVGRVFEVLHVQRGRQHGHCDSASALSPTDEVVAHEVLAPLVDEHRGDVAIGAVAGEQQVALLRLVLQPRAVAAPAVVGLQAIERDRLHVRPRGRRRS